MDAPQKYIRTFAGDIETVKKGDTPDLKPLEKNPTPSVNVSEQTSLSATIILPPQSSGHLSVPLARETLQHASPIQTYASDFSDRMKSTNASTATVLAAEQDGRKAPVEGDITIVKEPRTRGGILSVVGGIVLLLAGAVGAYYAYTRYLEKSAPVIITPVVSAPIFVDQSEEISGTGTTLSQTIFESLARPLAKGTIRFLYRPLITGADVSIFTALQLPAPDMLLRNIVTTGSMAGVIKVDSVSPFFILSVSSYTDTFAALLAWEPRMPRDLGALFPPEANLPLAGVATTTPPAVLVFHDEVIVNHDARVYRDAGGLEQIVYGYWNQYTLVIARDSSAFAEIIGRLATSRKQ